MKTVLMLIILVASKQCSTQKELSGMVRSKDSKLPIENCHVYINKNLGTITNKLGEFTLLISNQNSNRTLYVSHIEFDMYSINIKNFTDNQLIELEESVIMLDEIIIYP